jgi:DNA-binding GntR family transcriptional regulator
MKATRVGAAPREPRVALDLRTRQAAIYDTLTSMIGELELAPGVRLVEADLAARFQMSKTPIREALLLLQSDGLVKLEPYQGATVTWLSMEEYEELIYIQDSLEQPALPRIAERITRRDLNEFALLVKRLERRRKDHDSRGFFEDSALIHERLLGLAGSIRLVHVVMSLITHPTRRYERVFMHQFDDAWDIEMEIIRNRLDGIRAGDPAAAAASVREGRKAMLALIRSRLDHPGIAPYLAPSVKIQPPRMTRSRGRVPVRERGVGSRVATGT